MAAYSGLSDHELVVLLNKGDEAAYAEIYTRYWAILFRYSRRILQDDEEAGDVIQDVFVMLWSNYHLIELLFYLFLVSLDGFLPDKVYLLALASILVLSV